MLGLISRKQYDLYIYIYICSVRRKIIKRKINFLVKMCKNINSIATVATKYAVDELEILERLM